MTDLYWLTGAQLRRISNVLRQVEDLMRATPGSEGHEILEVCELPSTFWHEQHIGDEDDLNQVMRGYSGDRLKEFRIALSRRVREKTGLAGWGAKDNRPPPVPTGLAVTS